ncbi:MmcQ/YjbR family DNA-binding protein [Microbacterium sp. NPDC058062]|uniref:MmcQ/YjbR family DNA-binding protein n=1 Tax=Microbacterium sp. NPDC058062 TaxID=3346320 RepID=UPI0036DF9F71
MDGKTMQRQAADRTDQLPRAELTHPFGVEWDVWKVRDKVFMLQTEVTGEPLVILKAEPSDARALRQVYDEITPGYHMNKRHWITLHAGEHLEPDMVDDLVTGSYLLVVSKLPKSRQPVDPETFAQN